MSYEEFIFSETMKLVAAEIKDKAYEASKVAGIFEKYHPVVKELYSQHGKKSFLTPPKK